MPRRPRSDLAGFPLHLIQRGNNRSAHDRSGTLWEGRFRACGVHSDDYLLVCMRYIELNPVRAGIARSPDEYRWSSYRGNALGRVDPLLTEHPLYAGLGASPVERLIAYRQLFAGHMSDSELFEIRGATTSGHLLASEKSRRKFETERGRLLGPAPIGRPKASDSSHSDELQLLPFFRQYPGQDWLSGQNTAKGT